MNNHISKDNIRFFVEIWHRLRGSSLKRMAFLFVIAAVTAQFNIVQFVITVVANRFFDQNIQISDTPAWLSVVFAAFAVLLIVIDQFSDQISKHFDRRTSDIDRREAFQKLIENGEDIIRRQKIMATTSEWTNDPTIGVREKEGKLWRDSVKRHIFDKNIDNPEVLKTLEYIMDIDIHVFDPKFNKMHGTLPGSIDSYLNHSLTIQSFLMKHG